MVNKFVWTTDAPVAASSFKNSQANIENNKLMRWLIAWQ